MKSVLSWALVVFALSGCDKGSGATASTGSPPPSAPPAAKAGEPPTPTAAATPVPAATAPTCAEGFYAHTSPGFCIKLPEGVTFSRDENDAALFSPGEGTPLSVAGSDLSVDELVKDGQAQAANVKGKFEDKGDLPNGRKSHRYTNETSKGFETFTFRIVVPRPKGTLRCEVTGEIKKEKEPIFAKLIDACKTLEAR